MRQGRSAAVIGLVAAGAVLVVGVAAAWLDRAPETEIVARGESSSDALHPGAPVVAGPAAPEDLVVLRQGGEIAVLSRAGETTRVLAAHPAEELGPPSLAPDRRSVYYAVAPLCGAGSIYRVAVDGRSAPELVGLGTAPAVSPDGLALAFVRATASDVCPGTIVVRDLATGAERSWRYPDDEDHQSALYTYGAITHLAWAPDSRRLAYTFSYEGDTVAVLDTEMHADLAQTIEVVIPGGGGDSRHPAWQAGTDRLVVVNSAFECCFEDNYEGPARTLAVDLDSRKVRNVLPTGRQPEWLDYDLSGRHLLFIEDSHLYRRTGTGPIRLVATGVLSADW